MKTVKKFLSVLLALMIVLTAMPLTALPAFAVTSGDFQYEVLSETDKTCEITGYTGSATELTIPSELDGYTVTSIGYKAFYNCTALTSITIPDSVMSIGDYAFYNCHLLASVILGTGVTSIGYSAFGYCLSLTSITIPDSVTSIGDIAFAGCISLANIDVAAENLNYASENGVLFNKDKTTVLQYPASKTDSSYTIPDSVTSIGNRAFYNCTSLTSINIPDSVTSIGDDAFAGCISLTSITIPVGVERIGSMAFYLCFSLESITIPDNVTSIEWGTFFNCTSLTSIVIPDSVTSIGDNAFFDSGLKTIYGYTGSYAETYASEEGYTFVALNARGDVNGDGAPNSADYAMIKAYAIGNEPLDLGQKYVADLNRDGAVDAYDAIYLDLYLNGYIDTL